MRSETEDDQLGERHTLERPDNFRFWTQTEFTEYKKEKKGVQSSSSLKQLLVDKHGNEVSDRTFKGITNLAKQICQDLILTQPAVVTKQFHNLPITLQKKMFTELEQKYKVLQLCQDQYKAKLFLQAAYTNLPSEFKKPVKKEDSEETEDATESTSQTFAPKLDQQVASKLNKTHIKKDKGKGKMQDRVSF
jgi:predicted RND superfamily exporter protein